jgi:solute carrier family 35 protein C2
MSIAGIAKEVTTIMVSAIVFGDELTPLNLTGVGITIAGKFFPLHIMLVLKGRLIRAVYFRYLLVHIPQIQQIDQFSSTARS